MKIGQLIKMNLIQQSRNRQFILILLVGVFLGFLCVPANNGGYEIFWLGGVRGVYNSAWLGMLSVMLSTILLWLPSFYLLRSKISEDRGLKVGQLIAAAPVSKFSYITGKTIANFSIVCMLQLFFTLALMAMQLIRGENIYIALNDYLTPFIIIAVPYLFFLAVMTVLFDVIPFLQGTLGNILAFIVWVTLSSLSVGIPENPLDLFGIGKGLNAMIRGAKQFFPAINMESGSFGYYPTTEPIPTFSWEGMVWDNSFLISRVLWIIIALLLIGLSVIVFDRFSGTKSNHKELKAKEKGTDSTWHKESKLVFEEELANRKRVSFFQLLKSESSIVLSEIKPIWKVMLLAGAVISFIFPLESKWIVLLMLLPLPILSQTGIHEKQFSTSEIVHSCLAGTSRFWSAGFINICSLLFVSMGAIIRHLVSGNGVQFLSWSVAILFISALCLFCGVVTKNRNMFESIYIAWFYLGPINGIDTFNFLSMAKNGIVIYFCLTIVCITVGYFLFSSKWILKIKGRI